MDSLSVGNSTFNPFIMRLTILLFSMCFSVCLFGQGVNIVPNPDFSIVATDSFASWKGKYLPLHQSFGIVPQSPLGNQAPGAGSGYLALEMYSVLPLLSQPNFHAWIALDDTIFPGDEITLEYSITLADQSAFFGGAPKFMFFSREPDSLSIAVDNSSFSAMGLGSTQDTAQWIREGIFLIAPDTATYLAIYKDFSTPGPIAGTPTYQLGAMYFFDNINLYLGHPNSVAGEIEEKFLPLKTYNIMGREWSEGDGLKIVLERSNYGNFRTRKVLSLK